jgi:hypothetical protein
MQLMKRIRKVQDALPALRREAEEVLAAKQVRGDPPAVHGSPPPMQRVLRRTPPRWPCLRPWGWCGASRSLSLPRPLMHAGGDGGTARHAAPQRRAAGDAAARGRARGRRGGDARCAAGVAEGLQPAHELDTGGCGVYECYGGVLHAQLRLYAAHALCRAPLHQLQLRKTLQRLVQATDEVVVQSQASSSSLSCRRAVRTADSPPRVRTPYQNE